MNLTIGTSIKRLRKAKDITQEALANSLGVSFQAISKWERGEGYPDITMLPPLARVFGVTLDELMGMNALRDAEETQTLLGTSYANGAEGKIEANVSLLREGMKRFPAHDEIRTELARNLRALHTEEGNEEAITLFEHVLAHCTDSRIRNRATAFLCDAYAETGQRARAAAIAHTLPDVLYGRLIEADYLDGEEQQTALRNAFLSTAEALDWQFRRLYALGGLDDRETVAILHKSLAVLEIVLNGEYLHLAVNVAERYFWLAQSYMRLDEPDNARNALASAVKYAEEYDNQPDAYTYQTLPLRGLAFRRENYSKNNSEPYGQWLQNAIKEPIFAPLFA